MRSNDTTRRIDIPSNKTFPQYPYPPKPLEEMVNEGWAEHKPDKKADRPTTQHEADVAKFRHEVEKGERVSPDPRGPVSDQILSQIEPKAKQYYDLSHDLEGSVLLSQAISLRLSRPGPGAVVDQPVAETPIIAGETFTAET